MTKALRLSLAVAGLALCAAPALGQDTTAAPPAASTTSAPAPATAPAGLEGIYAVDIMEMASVLELNADGSFRWFLTYGALDMVGEGRWTRSGVDRLALESEPAWQAPRFDLVSATRDDQPGVLVTLADDNGEAPLYLDVQAEFDDGTTARDHFEEGARRFVPAPGRTITSIRVGSFAFDVLSDPHPVTAGGPNVFAFGFEPGDLGRANFQALPVAIAGDVLILPWRGEQMRYTRIDPALVASLREAVEGAGGALAGGTAARRPAGPDDELHRAHCSNEGQAFARELAIAGCTALIVGGAQTPANLQVVYFNRGNLRLEAGDPARAVADYDEALRLNQRYGAAYGGRAAAFTALGDERRAAIDSRRAARLAPRAAAAPASAAATAPAPVSEDVHGFYSSEGDGPWLLLEVDGRFTWQHMQANLPMLSEGHWARSTDGIVLNSQPAWRAPDFTLTQSSRDNRPGVLVSIAEESGELPHYLEVEAEYADGSRERATFGNGPHRFASTARRPVVAIKVGSFALDLLSERHPVTTDGPNVFAFGFVPNGIRRADFRNLPATVEGRTLTMTWRGTDLSYTRRRPSPLFDEVEEPGQDFGSDQSSMEQLRAQCVNDDNDLSIMNAISACTALLRSSGQTPEQLADTRRNRGYFHVIIGDPARAIADFDELLASNAEDAAAFDGRALAFADIGDFRRAVADSREAVRLRPDNGYWMGTLCLTMAMLGEELDAARNACDESLRLEADNAGTLDSRGLVGLRQRRFQDAWNDFDAAVRREPRNPEFLFGRGVAALRLGRAADGQADIAAATALDAGIAEAYASLGIVP